MVCTLGYMYLVLLSSGVGSPKTDFSNEDAGVELGERLDTHGTVGVMFSLR